MFAEMSVVELLSYLRDEPARRTQIVAEYDACNAPFSPEPWFEEWAITYFDRDEIFRDEDWFDWGDGDWDSHAAADVRRDDGFYFNGEFVPNGDWCDEGLHDPYWDFLFYGDDCVNVCPDFWGFPPCNDRDDHLDRLEERLLRRHSRS